MDLMRHATAKRLAAIALTLALPALAFVAFERLAERPAAPFAQLVETPPGRPSAQHVAWTRSAGQTLSAARPSDAAAKPPVEPRWQTVRAPILVYHTIRPPKQKLSVFDQQFEITPEQFEAQLSLLSSQGYVSIGYDDLVAALGGGKALPKNAVLIDLDDGRDSQYEYALPLLEKYKFKATFFIYTNAIGRPGFMTWAQVGEVRDAGMPIEAHTRSHPFLTRIADDAALEDEILGGKRMLEQKLGVTVRYFAYPFGLRDDRVIKAVKDAGFEAARGLRHAADHRPKDLYDLGGFIATGDLGYFRRQILGSKR